MSGQQPGAGSGPAPESAPRVTAATAAPAPVTTPYATGQNGAGHHDAGQPAAGAASGWGAPPASAPAWGMPQQEAPAPAAASGWGAPGTAAKTGSAAKPWTLTRGLAVAGAAAVLAVGAGVGVYALTSSSAVATGAAGTAAGGAGGAAGGQGIAPGMPGSAQGGFAGGGMSGQGGPGDFAAGGLGGGLSAAVHAEYVTLQGSEYTTVAEQLGTASEVSSSSVTVKSSDGFTRSYALGADVVVSNLQQRRQQAGGTGTQLSVADVFAGGTVRIVAVKDGSGYTASSVMVVAATATGQSN
ncbi:hypothetical protein SAMN04487916_111140 [Arthrobacter sp. ov407]|uniref:hypothetical protein n=1 Tax=Arthrobacter sp. ov407 TaxID=1761748 RepID=UPI00087E77B5|nr:hypothetical protein [Arthrobacter sp. ov407]SDL62477.1 hypothetical protein SAMN04487916_111140 [Arthrobacter sp. ov407]